MCNEDKGTTIKVCLLILVGVPPNACKGRVCHVEREDTMAAQPFVCHWTMVSCFHASLHFLQDIPGWRVPHSLSLRLFLCTRAPYFHPFRPSPRSQHQESPQIHFPNPILHHQESPQVHSPNPTLHHPATASIGRNPSQTGACKDVAHCLCMSCLSYLPQTSCCAFLLNPLKLPSISTDTNTYMTSFPGGVTSPLFQFSPRGVSPSPFYLSFSFSLFHLACLWGDCCCSFRCLRVYAIVQRVFCVNSSTCRCILDILVWRGEPWVLLFHHLDFFHVKCYLIIFSSFIVIPLFLSSFVIWWLSLVLCLHSFILFFLHVCLTDSNLYMHVIILTS